MSGFSLSRKMKRNKRELAQISENMNRDAIDKLMKQQVQLALTFQKFVKEISEKYNQFVAETVLFQKEVLAISNVLKRRRVITELEIAQERSAIEDMERMKREAIIINGSKKEKEEEVVEQEKEEEKG